MPLVDCRDDTCKHNKDGYCQSWIVEMETTTRPTLGEVETVHVCRNYEDRRDGTD